MLDPIELKTLAIQLAAAMPPCTCAQGCTPARGGMNPFLREDLAELLAESALPTVDEYNDAVRWVGDVQAIAESLVRTQAAGGVAPALLQGHAQRLADAAAGLRRFVERGHQ